MTTTQELVVDTDDGTEDGLTGARTARGPSRWMISMVHGYQLARSGRPTGCRYLPTCSEYAVEAIGEHGPLRGSALTARRLARCHPWGGHGIDPVPDRRNPCTHR